MTEAQDEVLKYQADLSTRELINGEPVSKLVKNVLFQQGNYTLKSDIGILYQRQNKFVFEGNVRFDDRIKKLNADKVVYDINERIFYFDEGIELSKEGKILTADKGIYYRDEGKSFCIGNVVFRDSVNEFRC